MVSNTIHPDANVLSKNIGSNTRIWKYVTVLPEAKIGANCNICDFCFIENQVTVGNNVTLKCGVYLWDGIILKDNVFVGPNVTFTNDTYPRSNKSFNLKHTTVERGASLGANSTLLGGITIGESSLIGVGSVVTKDVPSFSLVYGNPAKFKNWIDSEGNKLTQKNETTWFSEYNQETFIETKTGLKLI